MKGALARCLLRGATPWGPTLASTPADHTTLRPASTAHGTEATSTDRAAKRR